MPVWQTRPATGAPAVDGAEQSVVEAGMAVAHCPMWPNWWPTTSQTASAGASMMM